eukprot:1259015-Pleurochrysis_carterae.AAC.1
MRGVASLLSPRTASLSSSGQHSHKASGQSSGALSPVAAPTNRPPTGNAPRASEKCSSTRTNIGCTAAAAATLPPPPPMPPPPFNTPAITSNPSVHSASAYQNAAATPLASANGCTKSACVTRPPPSRTPIAPLPTLPTSEVGKWLCHAKATAPTAKAGVASPTAVPTSAVRSANGGGENGGGDDGGGGAGPAGGTLPGAEPDEGA